jgi:hypothetical protein
MAVLPVRGQRGCRARSRAMRARLSPEMTMTYNFLYVTDANAEEADR